MVLGRAAVSKQFPGYNLKKKQSVGNKDALHKKTLKKLCGDPIEE